MTQQVAVLFAHHSSVYKTIEGCDVWDVDRDALTWPGGCPVVAHPPCRLWGRLSTFSTAPAGETRLAVWAVEQVRKWGGVLEHPAHSRLWSHCDLPVPPRIRVDRWGGWTLSLPQWWFGHKADNPTWFYIVGCSPADVPPIPFRLGEPEYTVGSSRGRVRRPEVTKTERLKTPPDLAMWLTTLARSCHADHYLTAGMGEKKGA